VTLGSEPEPGGEWKEDFRLVAKAYYNGNRPVIPGDCPTLLSKLMKACWQDKQQDRPTAESMKQYAEADEETVATKWLEAAQFHTRMTYAEFLEKLSLTDRKDDLAEYLSHPNELTELAQMDVDDLEEDILKDLSFDEETKERFHAAVAELASKLKKG
jgi:hypothetical protein